jgi:hypothetical protein
MRREILEWHTVKEWEEIEKDPDVKTITFYAVRLKPKEETRGPRPKDLISTAGPQDE